MSAGRSLIPLLGQPLHVERLGQGFDHSLRELHELEQNLRFHPFRVGFPEVLSRPLKHRGTEGTEAEVAPPLRDLCASMFFVLGRRYDSFILPNKRRSGPIGVVFP